MGGGDGTGPGQGAIASFVPDRLLSQRSRGGNGSLLRMRSELQVEGRAASARVKAITRIAKASPVASSTSASMPSRSKALQSRP